MPCTAGKGLPGVTTVHQHILDPVEVKTLAKAPARSVTSAVVTWHGAILACPPRYDSRVIALLLGGVRVLDALGVHDTEAGLLFPPIALSGLANRFFLGLVPEWNPAPGRAARSIAGNTCNKCANRGSPPAAFATGSRFSGDTARRRKRHTSPRCGAWSGVGPTPAWAEYGRIAPYWMSLG